MTTVQIDKELQSRLTAAGEAVIVCDEQGNRVGLFFPDQTDKELYRRVGEMFSDEELERARRQPGGYTLQEILDELQAHEGPIRCGQPDVRKGVTHQRLPIDEVRHCQRPRTGLTHS